MRMVKLRKKVARLYELRRQLARANLEVDSGPKDASNASVCEALISRVKMGDNGWFVSNVSREFLSPKMSSIVQRLHSERTE